MFTIRISERGDGTVEAVYIQLSRKRVFLTKEVIEGSLFMDYAVKDQLVGIEILGPVKVSTFTE